ncbi:MAG: hypothetical protein MI924_12605 [Chloroflexales bacterium]|nr:hypothetical protein [Chloroflexales bacterium]
MQSFPPSKRSVRLAPRSAFRFGQPTRQGRVDRCRSRGAPGATGLPSAAFRTASVDLPFGWLSPGGPSPCPGDYHPALGDYAASVLPPARWRFRAPLLGLAVWEFPSSGVNDVIVTGSCRRYAGWISDTMDTVYRPVHPPPPLLGPVGQPLTPVARNAAAHAGFSRQHRSEGWSVICAVVGRRRTVVRRLRTHRRATPTRPLRSPHPSVQGWLLQSDRSYR